MSLSTKNKKVITLTVGTLGIKRPSLLESPYQKFGKNFEKNDVHASDKVESTCTITRRQPQCFVERFIRI